MAQNKWPPGATEIDECLTIYIVNMTARTLFKKDRWALHAFESAYRAVHAAGEIGFGRFKKFATAGAGKSLWRRIRIHGAKVVKISIFIPLQGRSVVNFRLHTVYQCFFVPVNQNLKMSAIFSPGKFAPFLVLLDLIEQEKTLIKTMTKEEKQNKTIEVIKNHVGFAVGAALMPVPGVDLLAVSAVQLNMLRTIAKIYGVGFVDSLGKNIVSAVVGSSAARLGASLIKAIPGVGTIIGELSMPALSGASTYALGRVVASHFHHGGTLEDLDLRKARKVYETEIENGKKAAEEVTRTESGTDATLEKISKMAEMKDAGIITEEEFKQLKERLLTQI